MEALWNCGSAVLAKYRTPERVYELKDNYQHSQRAVEKIAR